MLKIKQNKISDLQLGRHVIKIIIKLNKQFKILKCKF